MEIRQTTAFSKETETKAPSGSTSSSSKTARTCPSPRPTSPSSCAAPPRRTSPRPPRPREKCAGDVRGRANEARENNKKKATGDNRELKKRAERYFFYKGNFLFVERMMMKMEKDRRYAPFRRECRFSMAPSRAQKTLLVFGTVLVCTLTWSQVRQRENREE